MTKSLPTAIRLHEEVRDSTSALTILDRALAMQKVLTKAEAQHAISTWGLNEQSVLAATPGQLRAILLKYFAIDQTCRYKWLVSNQTAYNNDLDACVHIEVALQASSVMADSFFSAQERASGDTFYIDSSKVAKIWKRDGGYVVFLLGEGRRGQYRQMKPSQAPAPPRPAEDIDQLRQKIDQLGRIAATQKRAVCDLCNAGITFGQGFAFYDRTQIGQVRMGAILICQSCTDTMMTEAYWEGLRRDVLAGTFKSIPLNVASPDQIARIHHLSITARCLDKGLSPQQSKSKGRELAAVVERSREWFGRDGTILPYMAASHFLRLGWRRRQDGKRHLTYNRGSDVSRSSVPGMNGRLQTVSCTISRIRSWPDAAAPQSYRLPRRAVINSCRDELEPNLCPPERAIYARRRNKDHPFGPAIPGQVLVRA